MAIADVKLNETSLEFYRYDNKGNPSASIDGGYIGIMTKTDSDRLEFMDEKTSFGSKSVSNVNCACDPTQGVLKGVCFVLFI